MTDDREKLIEEMALRLKKRSARNPYVSWLDAASDALSVAERALAEKHARIAEGCDKSTHPADVADLIRASVEKKDD